MKLSGFVGTALLSASLAARAGDADSAKIEVGGSAANDFAEFQSDVSEFGVIEDGTGQIGEFKYVTSTFQIDSADRFSTADRKLVQVGIDLAKDADITFVVFPGWGEGAGQLGEKELKLLRTAIKKGYNNPRLLFVNPSGRATAEYVKNCDKVVEIGVKDELHDSEQIIAYLNEQNLLNGKIILLGHSLGAQDLEFVADDVNALRSDTRELVAVMFFAPASGQPLGAMRPDFVGRVGDYLIPAVLDVVRGKGCLFVSKEDYARKMNAGIQDAYDPNNFNFEGSVPDSARRFLGYSLSLRRNVETVPELPFFVFLSDNERLLPDKMGAKEAAWLRGHGAASVTEFIVPGPHMLPTVLSTEQARALDGYYDAAIPNPDGSWQ